MAFALLSNLYAYLRAKAERRLCLAVLGVDNAGKTTLVNTAQGHLDVEVTPTMGFHQTNTTSKTLGLSGQRFTLQVFDLGGGKNIRRVWRSYVAEVHAVVFVVDAADAPRLPECKQVLHETAGNALLSGKPILVFANKQDLPGAASAAQVAEQLGLTNLRGNAFHIKACTAKTPAGQPPDRCIREGLEWLLGTVAEAYTELNPRVKQDTLAAREEEARKKREREEKVRQIRKERARQQAEQAVAEEEARRKAEDQPPQDQQQLEQALHDGGGAKAALPAVGVAWQQPVDTVMAAAQLPGIIESPKPGGGISVWPAELTSGGVPVPQLGSALVGVASATDDGGVRTSHPHLQVGQQEGGLQPALRPSGADWVAASRCDVVVGSMRRPLSGVGLKPSVPTQASLWSHSTARQAMALASAAAGSLAAGSGGPGEAEAAAQASGEDAEQQLRASPGSMHGAGPLWSSGGAAAEVLAAQELIGGSHGGDSAGIKASFTARQTTNKVQPC